jgi:hypothetical protein
MEWKNTPFTISPRFTSLTYKYAYLYEEKLQNIIVVHKNTNIELYNAKL